VLRDVVCALPIGDFQQGGTPFPYLWPSIVVTMR
jgi:hypothetical protein